MYPLVSVIVPVYKVEEYLNRCVDSILAQTYQNLEIILVDDGSPDNCGKICDQYAEKDNRIRVIHKENGGVSSARNKGIEVAQGEFITFIDSDDYILNNHFSEFLDINQKEIDLIVSSFLVKTKDNDYKVENDDIEVAFDDLGEEDYKRLFDSSMCYVWNKFYKKSIIDSNNIRFVENVSFGEDTVFVYTYLKFINGVKFSSECTYCYEDKDSTATKKYWKDLFEYLKIEMDTYREFLNIVNADERTKKEVLGFYSTRFFRLLVNRHITKKPVFSFLREYSLAYDYFSTFFFKSTMIRGEDIEEDEKVLLKRGKWKYLLFVAKRIIKQHFKNKILNKKKNI